MGRNKVTVLRLSVLLGRLVRACMGSSAISDRKLDHGNPMVCLGVEINLKESGVVYWPSEDKVKKWTRRIQVALDSGVMTSGEASKLSGALQWATQLIFRKLGRAMLRPIIAQVRSRRSTIAAELRQALFWWLEVLQHNIR